MNPTQLITRLQEIRRFGFDNPGRGYSTAKLVDDLLDDLSREGFSEHDDQDSRKPQTAP